MFGNTRILRPRPTGSRPLSIPFRDLSLAKTDGAVDEITPLVLAQNEATESGHEYADVLGVSYQYPRTYRNLIRTGEPFVYYRSRKRASGGVQPQVYLGVGIVGAIDDVGDGLLECRIEHYDAFPDPLPFKVAGVYLEPRAADYGARAGLYFRQGVRAISEGVYARIVSLGTPVNPASASSGDGYASPELALLVDEVAMELAIAEAAVRYPGKAAERMPHNNPGYDVQVTDSGHVVRYIEVKGTIRPRPHFFLSEGERLFSFRYSERYSLWVFHRMDVDARTALLHEHDGDLSGPAISLNPVRYKGLLNP